MIDRGMSKARRGKPVKISARSHNAMLAAAREHEGGKLGSQPIKDSDALTVLVRNETPGTLNRFEVLELGELITRADALPVFEISRPTAQGSGKVAVVQDTIGVGKIGRAKIFGVSPVRDLEVVSESHDRAIAGPGGSAVTSEDGPLVILWVDDRAGAPRSAFVTITQAGAGAGTRHARIIGSDPIPGLFNRWRYEFELVKPDESGSWVPILDDEGEPSTGYALNTLEDGNGRFGVQGNGVDAGTLPEGFAIVPIGAGAVVEIKGPSGDAGLWFFTAANLVDGVCGG